MVPAGASSSSFWRSRSRFSLSELAEGLRRRVLTRPAPARPGHRPAALCALARCSASCAPAKLAAQGANRRPGGRPRSDRRAQQSGAQTIAALAGLGHQAIALLCKRSRSVVRRPGPPPAPAGAFAQPRAGHRARRRPGCVQEQLIALGHQLIALSLRGGADRCSPARSATSHARAHCASDPLSLQAVALAGQEVALIVPVADLGLGFSAQATASCSAFRRRRDRHRWKAAASSVRDR